MPSARERKRALRPGSTTPCALARGALALLGALAISGSGCSGAPPAASTPLFGTGVFHPPPKPGASISHTRMCECKMCDPVACCEGPDDDEAPKTCGDSYDFSSPGCGGLAVKSCTSRCTQQVWRVRAEEDCNDRRPETCCTAG